MKCPRSLSVIENGRGSDHGFLSDLHCLKKNSEDECSINVIAALVIGSIYTVYLHSYIKGIC